MFPPHRCCNYPGTTRAVWALANYTADEFATKGVWPADVVSNTNPFLRLTRASKVNILRHEGASMLLFGFRGSRGFVSSLSVLGMAFASSAFAAELGKPVTFTKDIAPIFQEKCQECHRTGSMAPMSLLTYQETRPWAKALKAKVVSRTMPPWHLDKTVGIQKFANDSSLNDEQVATIVRWVDAGAPMGDPKDMP